MSTLLWTLAGVAVLAGALLLALVRLRGGSGHPPRTVPPNSAAWTTNNANAGDVVTVRLAREDLKLILAEIQSLYAIRDDIRHVADLLQQGLSGALAAEQTPVRPPRAEPAGGTARDAFRQPARPPAPEPAQLRGGSWPPTPRDPDLRVQRDELDWGGDPMPATPVPGWNALAAVPPHEPSSSAEPVEARNDVVVHSERHPPEAWLERKSEVWLNARVTLTDAGLQRWSTFFDWERREPGARYQATRPATVTSSGSLVSKGSARPI